MPLEDQYAIALAVICVSLLGGGALFARWLSRANQRVVRIVWPVAALTTMSIFAGFTLIARLNAH